QHGPTVRAEPRVVRVSMSTMGTEHPRPPMETPLLLRSRLAWTAYSTAGMKVGSRVAATSTQVRVTESAGQLQETMASVQIERHPDGRPRRSSTVPPDRAPLDPQTPARTQHGALQATQCAKKGSGARRG